jgi:hypothetical protein
VRREPVHDPLQRAVVEDRALRDHHHALAERDHVLHVVGGEHHRRAALLLHVPQELVDRVLGHHVEADRRLVEEQHLRLVQQGGHQLQLHALAQRQVADRPQHQVAHPQHVDEFVPGALEAGGLDAVDLAVQPEALGGRQVPPQLVPLPHHQREAAAEGVGPLPGHVTEHGGHAPGGRDDAGEEFEERRLAGPVGSEQGHELTPADGQIHSAQGFDHAAVAPEQAADAGQQPLGLVVHPVFLGQGGHTDDGVRGSGGDGRPIGVVHGGSIGENDGPPGRWQACFASASATTRTGSAPARAS